MRECFPRAVVLGDPAAPLQPGPTCRPADISEAGQRVEACLCDTDLCNSYSQLGEETRQDTEQSKGDAVNTETGLDVLEENEEDEEEEKVVERVRTAAKTGEKPLRALKSSEEWSSESSGKAIVSAGGQNVSTRLRCFSCGDLFSPDTQCEFSGQVSPAPNTRPHIVITSTPRDW